ncbi:SCO family protein [Lysobacter helvus]|uniref:SCO family protein n=2 Tax=Lysobacteraceae TaxID=32033 RepID=A0ABN6FS09_9GAMM|nr:MULTISPECIES: SCO family protein [Lysobacter]BCT91695.1 SCO family protein [Lysobacter caseinilyticus]BCT94848.1 SCO family protein [Lysobacter helvus]
MKHLRAMATCVALLFASIGAAQAGTPAARPADSVYQLSVPLTDARGKTQDWRALEGKPRIVAMFYTSCPYMCPLIVESAKAVVHALPAAERERVGVVLISLDPARDTPAVLRDTATKRNIDTTRWLVAAPAPADVRKIAGVLDVRYRRLADGNFNHTSALVLLDAKGRIVARTEQVGPEPDAAFLSAVRAQLAK